jgi:hypothetical protein
VRLSPTGTAATTGMYQARMIDDGDCEAVGGIRIGRGNRSSRSKPAPAPLCQSEIPHDQTRSRTRTASDYPPELWLGRHTILLFEVAKTIRTLDLAATERALRLQICYCEANCTSVVIMHIQNCYSLYVVHYLSCRKIFHIKITSFCCSLYR